MEDEIPDISEPEIEVRESSSSLKKALRILLCKLGGFYIYLNTNVIFASIILLALIGITISLVVVSVLFYPVHIDFSLRAFEVPNHIASQRQDSFLAVREDIKRYHSGRHKQPDRVRRENTGNSLLFRTQHIKKWKLDVVYVADDGNIFTADKLKIIHDIEEKLLRDHQFQKFCWRSEAARKDPILRDRFNGCTPPNSLIGYFYRTNFYDGLGNTLADIPGTLEYLLSRSSTFWYVDEHFSGNNRKSRLLRSQLYFGIPLRGFEYDNTFSTFEAQHNRFKSFIVEFVNNLKFSSSRNVRVLYGSPEIFDYQVMNTFRNDLMLAIASFVLILCLVFLLSSFSFWLTFCGTVSIILSVPLAYFFYRVCLNMETVGILTGASIFVIIGIGVDDVFVIINIYRQSLHIDDKKERMVHCIRTAGKATFFTSFTTAAAFGANILSQIPAVHDFGLYSCIVVMACWVVVMLGMPPCLTLWTVFFRKCEKTVCCCQCCRRRQNLHHTYSAEQLLPSYDAEIDMDTIGENENQSRQEAYLNDFQLRVGGAGNGIPHSEEVDSCSLSAVLQHFLNKFVAKPVIRGRFIVVAIFIIVFSASIYATSKLSTRNGRTELFSPNSNLQKLLDLRYNLSAEDYDCTSCSGLYSGMRMSPNPNSRNSASERAHQVPQARPPVPRKVQATAAPTSRRVAAPTERITSKEGVPISEHFVSGGTTRTTKGANESNDVEMPKTTPWNEGPPPVSDPTVPPDHVAGAMLDQTKPPSKARKLCPTPSSCKPAARPILDKTALVYVVFGVKGIDRSSVSSQHVLTSKGVPIYDDRFTLPGLEITSVASGKMLSALCKVCNMIESNRELVSPGGGDCFPLEVYHVLQRETPYEDCRKLKIPRYVKGKESLSIINFQDGVIKSVALAFESTTPRGKPAFEAVHDYKKWEDFLKVLLSDKDISSIPAFRSGFQTSAAWVKMFSEIIAVNGAVYGTITSVAMCFAAVVVFTGNLALTAVVFFTIIGVLCVVLSLFFLAGWQMGAVEAVSLSILVGTSVDYTVHLVEGYMLAGRALDYQGLKNKDIRRARTGGAVSHIGVSILSSALTTLTAAIPLCFTQIQLFAKFGQILAMNTGFSLLYTLTVGVALLSIFGPCRYLGSLKARAVGAALIIALVGLATLILYLLSKFGHMSIPGPNGDPIFE